MFQNSAEMCQITGKVLVTWYNVQCNPYKGLLFCMCNFHTHVYRLFRYLSPPRDVVVYEHTHEIISLSSSKVIIIITRVLIIITKAHDRAHSCYNEKH